MYVYPSLPETFSANLQVSKRLLFIRCSGFLEFVPSTSIPFIRCSVYKSPCGMIERNKACIQLS